MVIDGSEPNQAISFQSRVFNIADTPKLIDLMQKLNIVMIEEALSRSKVRKELAASYLRVSRYP